MADSTSEFWRRLAGEFRAVNCRFGTSIKWTSFSDNKELELVLHSEDSDHGRSTKAQFDALCTAAGLRLQPDSDDPFFLWLKTLVHESPNDVPGQGHALRNGVLRESGTGRINNPCLASANLCNKLQMNAMKAEQDENRAKPSNAPTLALSELRKIGLDIDLTEAVALQIYGGLLDIDGRFRRGSLKRATNIFTKRIQP